MQGYYKYLIEPSEYPIFQILFFHLTNFSRTSVLPLTLECITASEWEPHLAEELLPANPEIHINFHQCELDSTE